MKHIRFIMFEEKDGKPKIVDAREFDASSRNSKAVNSLVKKWLDLMAEKDNVYFEVHQN